MTIGGKLPTNWLDDKSCRHFASFPSIVFNIFSRVHHFAKRFLDSNVFQTQDFVYYMIFAMIDTFAQGAYGELRAAIVEQYHNW